MIYLKNIHLATLIFLLAASLAGCKGSDEPEDSSTDSTSDPDTDSTSDPDADTTGDPDADMEDDTGEDVEEESDTMTEQVAAPTFEPPAGTYTSDQEVALSTTTTGATIHYTIDGSDPTSSSTEYTTAIAVAGDGTVVTIKAMAVMTGMLDSAVAEATYEIDYESVATPTFSPSEGMVVTGTTVTITTETSGSTIWYTTGDGSQPDPTCGTGTSGTEGASTAEVIIDEDQAIKAMGCQTGWADSAVAQSSYHVMRIYIADMNNDRIVRMDDMTGSGWTTLGTEGSGTNQFNNPYDVALDSMGRIYILDRQNNRIVRVDDMTGTNWTVLCDNPPSSCSSGSGTNQFRFPESLYIDASDRIYVADAVNNRIVRMDDITGANWTVLCDNPPSGCTSGSGTNQFNMPSAISVTETGQIYVADTYNHRIVRVDDMDGTNWTVFGSYGTDTNEFNYPYGIFCDSTGHIYVGDGNNGRVVSMDDMTGTNWRSYAGTDPLYYTTDVFVDFMGRIYIVDHGVDFIARMDDMLGTNWVTLGTEGTGVNEFTDPRGIFVK